VRRDAPFEVFIVIAFSLDRRNAVPVEELSGGKDILRHKRDAYAGTIQGARRVGVFSGVVGLGELDADLVARADPQVTLRLFARIDGDRLVAKIEQLAVVVDPMLHLAAAHVIGDAIDRDETGARNMRM